MRARRIIASSECEDDGDDWASCRRRDHANARSPGYGAAVDALFGLAFVEVAGDLADTLHVDDRWRREIGEVGEIAGVDQRPHVWAKHEAIKHDR